MGQYSASSNLRNFQSDLNISTGRPSDGIFYAHRSNHFLEFETVFVKDEKEQHNLISKGHKVDEKCITTKTSSDNNFDAETSTYMVEYDIDETLEIKEEIIQGEQNSEIKLKISLGRPDSSSNNFGDQTSTSKTVYNDESLDVQEEPIQEKDTVTGEKRNQVYEWSETHGGYILVYNKLPDQPKKKLSELELELEKKYKCENCARTYKTKEGLRRHKCTKLEEDVIPQFPCEFCGRRFKQKKYVTYHIDRVHQKDKSKASQIKYSCNTCARNYSSSDSLKRHKRLEHEAAIPKFICDICGHKTSLKTDLKRHISSRHEGRTRQRPKSHYSILKHYCDKCPRSYRWLGSLTHHKRLEHAAVKPQFTCDICGHKTKLKGGLVTHITSQHLNKQ
ncbi:GDNF-inducible zinc finger protein 1-like [Belonocnema kinseyi]|uniref:GDNF-inducible zinc finger protein 1-like n=1 Tax=Belonocnema kinseyi TaxID=2817044 RepID=UPI00143CD05B|nr:GDNF-inducible zinc finger protein 1-like [Belonocnema kinseyi]